MMKAQEAAVLRKVFWRLIPYLLICYVFSYLDRYNVSYAAPELNLDLKFNPEIFGFGAGIFFLGYFLFEIPSNLLLERFGARIWLSRIMVVWGLVASAMILIRTPLSFYLMRFFLGLSEAGFMPGVIFYLSRWIPGPHRARAFGYFLTSTALAGVIGGFVNAAILQLKGVAGLHGWQWLFLSEGIPSVLLGFFTFFYLTDKPAQAKWLTAKEREWLTKTMEKENKAQRDLSIFRSFIHPMVLRFCLLDFCIFVGIYGIAFWLPQIVKSLSDLGPTTVSLVSVLPYLAGCVAMVLTARHSDRTGERRWHVAVPAFTASLGLVLVVAFYQNHPWVAFLMLCVTAAGMYSTRGPFWSMPTAFLGGTAAAAGIALVNSTGNLGGFVGPNIMGFVTQRTGHLEGGMLVLAGSLLMAGLLALSVRKDRV